MDFNKMEDVILMDLAGSKTADASFNWCFRLNSLTGGGDPGERTTAGWLVSMLRTSKQDLISALLDISIEM